MRVAKEERIRKETALEALESALKQRGRLRRPRRGTAGWKAIEQAICWWKGNDNWLNLPRDIQDIDLRTATAWRTYRQKGVGVMSKDVDTELLAIWAESLYEMIGDDKSDISSNINRGPHSPSLTCSSNDSSIERVSSNDDVDAPVNSSTKTIPISKRSSTKSLKHKNEENIYGTTMSVIKRRKFDQEQLQESTQVEKNDKSTCSSNENSVTKGGDSGGGGGDKGIESNKLNHLISACNSSTTSNISSKNQYSLPKPSLLSDTSLISEVLGRIKSKETRNTTVNNIHM